MYPQLETVQELLVSLCNDSLSRAQGRKACKAAKAVLPYAKHGTESDLHAEFNNVANLVVNCTVPMSAKTDVLTVKADLIHEVRFTDTDGKTRTIKVVRIPDINNVPLTVKNRVCLTPTGCQLVDMANPFKTAEGVWGPKVSQAPDGRKQVQIIERIGKGSGSIDGKPIDGTTEYYVVGSAPRYAYHHSQRNVFTDLSESCKIAFDASLRARDIEAMQNDPRWGSVTWVSNVLYGVTNENYTPEQTQEALDTARKTLEDRARNAIANQALLAASWLEATIKADGETNKEAKMAYQDKANALAAKAEKRQEGIAYFSTATADEIDEASCVSAVRDGQHAIHMDSIL